MINVKSAEVLRCVTVVILKLLDKVSRKMFIWIKRSAIVYEMINVS